MAISCPKCGKPVHAGAKFCGNCGNPIPATPSSPPPAPAAPSQGGLVCPNCKKTNNPNAKFCRSCGKALTPQAAQTPPAPPTSGTSSAAAPIVVTPPAFGPQGPAGPSSLPPKKSPRKGLGKLQIKNLSNSSLIIGGIILVILCMISIAITLLFFRDKIIPVQNTATPTAPLVDTTTLEPTTRKAIGTPVQTAESTATATEPPVLKATDTPTVTEIVNPSPTASSSTGGSPTVVLFEGFDTGWQSRWILWGNPRPTVSDTNPALVLDSQVGGSESGATSQSLVSLDAGTTIQFEGQVDITKQVIFDWDPSTIIRQPGSEPGVIHLTIGNGQVTFQITRVGNTIAACKAIPLPDNNPHLFQILISDKYNPTFLIDAGEQCALPDQVEVGTDTQGRVSFSGSGVVDNLKILHP